MADAEKLVPGTWFITKTLFDGRVNHVMMTFTSDGGMVERAEPSLEAGIGVWKPGDEEDEEDEFRFMFYRFQERLTITEPQEETKGEKEEKEEVDVSFDHIQRIRSTNRLTSHHGFQGTETVDFLDATGTLDTAMPTFHNTLRAVRLKLVPES